jgi:hypothetical protein
LTVNGISCKVYITPNNGASVLAFLDSLCTALLARNAQQIHELLQHPLARALPRQVREEAMLIARRGGRAMIAPVQTLRLYNQTAHLLGACSDPATAATNGDLRQLEMFVAQ